jgi:hypothetical protein
MVRMLLLPLLLVACSVSPEATPETVALTELAPVCGEVFTVTDPAIPAHIVQNWADRWSAATGCPVTVGEGGIPMSLTDDLHGKDGTKLSGNTTFDHQGRPLRIELDPAQFSIETLGHEMGHALALQPLHAADGVLSLRAPDRQPTISAETLSLVCERHACAAFIPEAPVPLSLR